MHYEGKKYIKYLCTYFLQHLERMDNRKKKIFTAQMKLKLVYMEKDWGTINTAVVSEDTAH